MYDLKRVGDAAYEIPKNEKIGMNVPVRLYANKYILEHMQKDRTLMQAVNASMLPSIAGNMLVMPDGHEGYGFPVGGVAAFDAENGIVSPGAIGFDINCLHGESRVMNRFGAWECIRDMSIASVKTYDRHAQNADFAPVLLKMKKKSEGLIMRIRTKCGKTLLATQDHPILTEKGMVEAGRLKEGDRVAISGFEGVQFSKPSNEVIIDMVALNSVLSHLGKGSKSNSAAQILSQLHKWKLAEVHLGDHTVPVLLKVMGMVFGDGTIPKATLVTTIYGKPEDLQDIKRDLASIGIRASIHPRHKNCSITTMYGTQKFSGEEYSLSVPSRAFGVLMAALGVPLGNKSVQAYGVPMWVKHSEKWQKRLFLAAYFGAEMTKPIAHNGYSFSEPTVGINKLESLELSAVSFLKDIKEMLGSLSIGCSEISKVPGYAYDSKHGRTMGYRLEILSSAENLTKFFSTISYEYNRSKAAMASIAALYLEHLHNEGIRRNPLRVQAIAMYNSGSSATAIMHAPESSTRDMSFIRHSIYGRHGNARVWGIDHFDEFMKNTHIGGGFALDGIESIEAGPYSGYVYDITVGNKNHNFIANGIVVSNCGIRLIKTNMSEADVRPRLNALMDALFKNVPSGVGSKIKLGFTDEDLDRVAAEGTEYIIGKGYGWPGDSDKTEENGRINGADPGKVSSTARARGKQQLGTLGAGNHFLEVQRVEKIFDERLAKAFGMYENQIVVMLHSGSRGYGHQVCSDYLDSLSTYQEKHGIKLPDPELAYAYLDSKEAQDYLGAMRSAVNFAFTNRQIMMNSVRRSFGEVFSKSSDNMGMEMLYDVAHNIAKLEEHVVEGRKMKLIVHRKGATRAFAPGRKEVPKEYREYGQPVIIPGSMGTASYVLAGREEAMLETFGSSCHGSGRLMSRHQAMRDIPMSKTLGEMEKKSIAVRVRSKKLISEEAMEAYKNVDDVVATISEAKISNIVARLVPIGVAKG